MWAWEAGAGRRDVWDDDDLIDASFLAMSDGQGGTWWRPSRLDDVYALPDSVLTMFRYYRMGQLARENPFDWWRATDTGKPEFAHQFPASFTGVPESPARCGAAAPQGAVERTGGAHPCPRCHAIAEPRESSGAPGSMRFVAEME
jgi:hypothetical protein